MNADFCTMHNGSVRRLSKKSVATIFGVSESTIMNWVKRGDFPVPIRLRDGLRWTSEQVTQEKTKRGMK